MVEAEQFSPVEEEEEGNVKLEGNAVAGIRALEQRLAEENPAFSGAIDLENDAEIFSRTVRAALREHRKAQGLDQGDVAERLDMTQSAVSKIENGEGDLGIKSVFRYAHALGLIPMCTFLPDSRLLFPEEAAAAAKAVQNFQTGLIKDTSNALSSAVAGFARLYK